MRWALVMMCCGLGFLTPATALAVGGPVPPAQGGAGVSAPGGGVRYIAESAGAQGTVVDRVGFANAIVQRSAPIAGTFGIPGAAYDGSSTGLAADGRTLVLAELGVIPAQRTRLLVLDALRLRVKRHISLGGFYTVDAVSPTGRWMYLIHYLSSNDLTRYEVQAYDLQAGRMLLKPVIDPRDREQMHGMPVSRVMSADGRWAYTLYARPGSGSPFVHALDTQRRAAVCVDLPMVPSDVAMGSHLALAAGGAALRIMNTGATLAIVDTRSFAVRGGAPGNAAPRRAATRHAAAPGAGGGKLWLIAIPGAALLAVFVLVGYRRRKVRSEPLIEADALGGGSLG